MRLIDANAFSRKMQDDFHGCYSEIQLAPYQVDRMLDNQPTVDAVPVVRCCNCKNAYINSFSKSSKVVLCKLMTNLADGNQQIRQFDDFCSSGKRKD